MQKDSPGIAEWQRGWTVVLGAMIASGLGIPLFYYMFSLFVVPLSQEFGMTRGEFASVQALVVVGVFSAPVIGRMLDRFGFLWVFGVCTALAGMSHIMAATWVSTGVQFALIAAIIGLAGVGGGPLAYTRPINAWFWHSRGRALGIAALGLAVFAGIFSPVIEWLIQDYGWRAGFLALGALALGCALPATLLLMKNEPPEGPAGPVATAAEAAMGRFDHFRDPNFWMLFVAMICLANTGAGLISQMAPIAQEEGVGATEAAFAITAYATGQVAGRIVTGWFLDMANPQRVAFATTLIPSFGLVMLAGFDLSFVLTIVAIGVIGFQQGAEIDIFAYFTARRFGVARYGTVFGWIISAMWIGNTIGILSFGWLHDAYGSYVLAEWIAAALLIIGAILLALVSLNAPSHSSPEQAPAP